VLDIITLKLLTNGTQTVLDIITLKLLTNGDFHTVSHSTAYERRFSDGFLIQLLTNDGWWVFQTVSL